MVTPRTERPGSSRLTSNEAREPARGAPITAHSPPIASESINCSSTVTLPVVSTARSSPRCPVSSSRASVSPVRDVSTTSVAPIRRARSSREPTRSTAMTSVAGVSRAAMTAASPTAPAPVMAIVLPALGRKTFSTAPAPVCRPQPSGASTASSSAVVAGGSTTTLRSSTSASRANEDWPKKCALSSRPR